jgi:hypothetical protein
MEDLLPTGEPGSVSGDQLLPSETRPFTRPCVNCSQPSLEGDYLTPLCGDCRERFTRLSIPLWIKLFAGGVGVVLLFSLFSLPGTFSLGIHLRRGEKAIENHNYMTAQQELKKVLVKVPDNVEANGNMLIASFYNEDFKTLGDEVSKLQGASTSNNEDLFSRIDEVMEKAAKYAPSDEYDTFKTAHPVLAQIPDSTWARYFSSNADDRGAMMQYASLLFDRHDYRQCDSVVRAMIRGDDEYFPALMMGASAKREMGDPEGALKYCDRILSINHESSLGLASKSRSLLKEKKDAAALALAQKSYAYDPQNEYSAATLILAYHFNGKTGDRDAMIGKARAVAVDSLDKEALQYALDVIDKKEKFRDYILPNSK